MKTIRLVLAMIALSALTAGAIGQTAPTDKPGLTSVKQDLVNAIDALKPCLPIYDGHMGSERNLLHAALRRVNSILNPKPAEKAAPVKPAAPAKESKPVEKAAPAKPAPTPVSAKPAEKPKEYSADEIAASQANLQKSSEALDQAVKDLKAVGDFDQAAAIASILAKTQEEVKFALAVHAAK
jgi:hypothetical protein